MPIGGYYHEPGRGAIAEYDNKWNQASWEGWLTYRPADNPQRLDKPLAVVHSEAAAIPRGVKYFLKGFTGEATMRWLENVTQFDFYDNPRMFGAPPMSSPSISARAETGHRRMRRQNLDRRIRPYSVRKETRILKNLLALAFAAF